MTYEFRLKNIKYIPKPLIVTFVMIIILFSGILYTVLTLGELSLYFFVFFIVLWSISFAIYFVAIKEGVDYIDEKEIKLLLKFLDKSDVIDYTRELIQEKSISNIKHVGIEIDAKFGTFICQKKGLQTGVIRDEWLYNKIEELHNKILNENKK